MNLEELWSISMTEGAHILNAWFVVIKIYQSLLLIGVVSHAFVSRIQKESLSRPVWLFIVTVSTWIPFAESMTSPFWWGEVLNILVAGFPSGFHSRLQNANEIIGNNFQLGAPSAMSDQRDVYILNIVFGRLKWEHFENVFSFFW